MFYIAFLGLIIFFAPLSNITYFARAPPISSHTFSPESKAARGGWEQNNLNDALAWIEMKKKIKSKTKDFT